MHQYKHQCKKTIAVHQAGTTEFCKIDDNTVASASHDKSIKIWNVKDGTILKSIDDNVGGSIISLIAMR